MGKDWLEEREAFLFNWSCKHDAYLAWGLGMQRLRSKAIVLLCVAGAPTAQSSQKLGRALQFAGVETSPIGRWRHPFPVGLSFTNCIPRPQLKSLVTFSYFFFFLESEMEAMLFSFLLWYMLKIKWALWMHLVCVQCNGNCLFNSNHI